MKKLIILIIILPILFKMIQTIKIAELNHNDDTTDTFFNINRKNFNKIFRHITFISISIENRKLFSNILQLISTTKSYFIINNKFCFNNIINEHTNYFINAYYENADILGGSRRRKRDTVMVQGQPTNSTASQMPNTTLSYTSVINLNHKNYGGFIFEITNFNMFAHIINCYLAPDGTYLFIINNSKVDYNNDNNNDENSSDYLYEDFFQDSLDITLDDIATLFNEIWTKYQNFKIFIYLNHQIITYNPFYYNFTVKGYGKLIVNDSDSVTDGAEFLSDINLKQLNGYPLKIEIFTATYVFRDKDWRTGKRVWVGADYEVASTLKRVMNYTEVQIKSDAYQFGYQLPNGSYTGTLGRLIRRSSDIAINGFFIKDYLTRDIEFTTAVYSDQLCLTLSKAKRIPSSLLPLLCFKSELWGLILLVTIGSSIFWCLIRRINDTTYFNRIYESNYKRRNNVDRFNRSMWILKHKPFQYYQILVDTVILMGSVPMRRFTKVATERCFIVTLCIISLVFVSIFQSKLATVFIEPIFYKDILTLKELEQSQRKIMFKFPAMMDDMFPPNTSKLMDNLQHQLFLINPKRQSYTDDMYRELGMATVIRRSRVKLDMAIFVKIQKIFLVPECPKTYNLAYVVNKDSVYLNEINDVLMHLVNGGLINKWINDMYYNRTLFDLRTSGYFYVAKFKILTVADFQLAFMILAVGILISAVLFVIELKLSRCVNYLIK